MQLKIPPGQFGAYLFDCDGTIADSMPVHHRAWQGALSEWNCTFPEELFYSWGGTPTKKVIEQLNAKYNLAMPIEAVEVARERLYQTLLPTVQPIAAVVEHVHSQSGKIPLAVVSGSPRVSVIATLKYLGLLHHFKVVVAAEDSPRGKPFPDPFLTAAQALNVEPGKCLVFEDAELGIQSARAAGMQWVRVPPTRKQNS